MDPDSRAAAQDQVNALEVELANMEAVLAHARATGM
jgi:hypothetical protein